MKVLTDTMITLRAEATGVQKRGLPYPVRSLSGGTQFFVKTLTDTMFILRAGRLVKGDVEDVGVVGTWRRRWGARRHYDGTQLVALFIGLVSPVVGTSPPGRLLNRFLEDVNAMGTAINIMGVMFGFGLAYFA